MTLGTRGPGLGFGRVTLPPKNTFVVLDFCPPPSFKSGELQAGCGKIVNDGGTGYIVTYMTRLLLVVYLAATAALPTLGQAQDLYNLPPGVFVPEYEIQPPPFVNPSFPPPQMITGEMFGKIHQKIMIKF